MAKYNSKGERWCCGWNKGDIKGHYTSKDNFYKTKCTKDGLDPRCKQCRKITNTKYNPNSHKRVNNPMKLTKKEKDDLEINYVYYHTQKCGKIMYVGIGRDGRAWDFTLRRYKDHTKWLLGQLKRRSPTDIVKLVAINKTNDIVKIIEDRAIKKYKPKFNRT